MVQNIKCAAYINKQRFHSTGMQECHLEYNFPENNQSYLLRYIFKFLLKTLRVYMILVNYGAKFGEKRGIQRDMDRILCFQQQISTNIKFI